MKKIIVTLIAITLIFTACATKRVETYSDSITLEVPEGTDLQLRIRTADGTAVEVIGSDTKLISGNDTVRELGEEKPMQKLIARESKLTFRGNIREFDIKDNKTVRAIDLRNAANIEVLYCAGNMISELDLSQNKKLKRLQCYNNRLSTLNLKNQKELTLLWCGINNITSLDVSSCSNLTQLRCYRNQIKTAEMDALLKSLPQKNAGDIAEARILGTGATITNEKPSKMAIDEARKKAWKVLDSNDVELE